VFCFCSRHFPDLLELDELTLVGLLEDVLVLPEEENVPLAALLPELDVPDATNDATAGPG
jgi:hypothetical protein